MDLNWVADEWAPDAAVIGPGMDPASLGRLDPGSLVSVTVDRSADRIASVCLDEESIGAVALRHLLATGLRCVSTCRYSQSTFAVARERGFVESARAEGLQVAVGWGSDDALALQWGEDPACRRESIAAVCVRSSAGSARIDAACGSGGRPLELTGT